MPTAARAGVTGRGPEPRAELVPPPAPPASQLPKAFAHRDRASNGLSFESGRRHRIVEKDHDAVAGQMLERAAVLRDHLAHRRLILAEYAENFLRLGCLGKG